MIFLAIYASLSCLIHLALYRFTLRWLDISHPALRAGLVPLFAMLAFSFMGTFFLLRSTQAPWAIGLYRVAAVWQALAVNLFLAATACRTGCPRSRNRCGRSRRCKGFSS